MKEVVVYIFLNDGFVPAGRLAFENLGRYSRAFFQYGQQYLKRKDAISLDPIQLPLLHKTFETEPGFDLFNGIRDAGPDKWGRYLLDKKYHHALDELDYLVHAGPDRVGALAFSETLEDFQLLDTKRLDLKLCVDAAQAAILDEDTDALKTFLSYGPSLGGARPKATVIWNNKPHVAKFTLSMDVRNESLIEYATMSLAKKCGLTVPSIDITHVSGRDVFLIERFDRMVTPNHEKRIPFISGLTATGQHEQDYREWSYLRLLDAIYRLSPDPQKDAQELFRRMVFNILVYNNDDHMRNHGFLYDDKNQWRLSPLYDVVPGVINTNTYLLAMRIGQEGKAASIENALSSAGHFHLTTGEARQLIADLLAVCRDWEAHFGACGIKKGEMGKLRQAIRPLVLPPLTR